MSLASPRANLVRFTQMSQRSTLRPTFLAHCRAAEGTDRLTGDALEDLLQAVVERGRAAWPDLGLSPETFVEYLAQRLNLDGTKDSAKDGPKSGPKNGDALAEALRKLQAEDLYLACACIHGHKGAIAALTRGFIGQVPALISHLHLSKDELEDVCQTLGERLLIGRMDAKPRLAEYSGRGALLGWIRMAALREALDRRRSQQRTPVNADAQEIYARTPDDSDPQQEFVKRRYRQHFEEALRSALSHLSAEQRNILRLHFLDGLSIDKLGVLFKVHRATAARWIVTAQRALLTQVRADLKERLQLNLSEVDSIAKLVRSQLHLSLPRLLLEPGGGKEPGSA